MEERTSSKGGTYGGGDRGCVGHSQIGRGRPSLRDSCPYPPSVRTRSGEKVFEEDCPFTRKDGDHVVQRLFDLVVEVWCVNLPFQVEPGK